jgi:hypothetical protein
MEVDFIWMSLQSTERTSALDDANQKNHNGQDQQDVDEPAHGV